MRLEFFPVPFLSGVGILAILLLILWRRKRTPAYLFCFAVFGFYFLILIGLTLFPMPGVMEYEGLPWRESFAHIFSRINLIPLNYGGFFPDYSFLVYFEIKGNILLTIPFGFGINFLLPGVLKKRPWLAFSVGFAIETAQLISMLAWGISYRGVDINDVVWNTLGVFIGWGFFRVFVWLFSKIKLRFGMPTRGFLASIDEMIQSQ
jgi:glycopeptide antibiotics resistance protein